MSEIGKILIVSGIVLVAIGLFLYFFNRLPFNLGHLPGDISYKGEKFSFYFPITTSIIISVILSLFLYLFSSFFK